MSHWAKKRKYRGGGVKKGQKVNRKKLPPAETYAPAGCPKELVTTLNGIKNRMPSTKSKRNSTKSKVTNMIIFHVRFF